ncbi:hypothetical protein KAJ83_04470 [Marivibrio halodurans]|uniref:Ankyrin repeat-containing protein n=1 Tax=Marivibrio halodurans TaxID=2039722 RepID=A0A8J7S623_9PROT|nr:ankyrin repeat domain-containing protein [Marivibrio halodurans]MBP5856252.1 hypothetical protein [Marivibrio halodurans]
MLYLYKNMKQENNKNHNSGNYNILRGAYFNNFSEVDGALETEPRCIENTDHLGRTALHIAAQRGFVDMVMHLSEQDGVDFSATDLLGRTALDVSWESAKSEIPHYLSDRMYPSLFTEFTP